MPLQVTILNRHLLTPDGPERFVAPQRHRMTWASINNRPLQSGPAARQAGQVRASHATFLPSTADCS